MKSKIFAITLAVILMLSAALQAVEMKIPDIEKATLDNGLDVYIIEQHEVPIVSMRLVIPGGTLYDTEETAGLANLTSGLLRKGTTTRTGLEVSEEIDFIGGQLGAGAGNDAIYATSTVLAKHIDKGMELLADIVINPIFPDEEVEKLKNQIVGAIMQGKSDPTTIRDMQFAKFVFGNHPYGLPSIGTEETMMLLTQDDVKEFYNKYFIPNNAFLLIVGDVSTAEVLGKVRNYFGDWKEGTPVDLNLPEMPEITGRKVYLIDKPDATQSFIAIGHQGLSRTNPDAFKVRVMNYILGGGGFVSRLMKNVRSEKGLTYGINSGFDYNRHTGSFYVKTFTKNESTGEAIESIFDEMNKIRQEPIKETELEECQGFYSGYLPLQFETPANIASWMETIYLYDLGDDYYTRYIQSVNQATVDDVQEVANEYIDPNDCLIVVVGKAEEIQDQLAQFGEIEVIPLIEL